jgi:hypothetical protein
MPTSLLRPQNLQMMMVVVFQWLRRNIFLVNLENLGTKLFNLEPMRVQEYDIRYIGGGAPTLSMKSFLL